MSNDHHAGDKDTSAKVSTKILPTFAEDIHCEVTKHDELKYETQNALKDAMYIKFDCEVDGTVEKICVKIVSTVGRTEIINLDY